MLISSGLGVSYVQSEITGRTSPNLIDLGIAIAAAVAGSFSMTRKQLSNSIAGVAIAVALVPPLCVSGIGLTLGSEMVAVFGRGTVAGLTNQIAEGSFLLFLANLIGITVTSLVVFLVQRYGSLVPCLGLRIQLKSLQCSHSELFSWLVGRPKIKLNSRQRWWPTKWPSAIPA